VTCKDVARRLSVKPTHNFRHQLRQSHSRTTVVIELLNLYNRGALGNNSVSRIMRYKCRYMRWALSTQGRNHGQDKHMPYAPGPPKKTAAFYKEVFGLQRRPAGEAIFFISPTGYIKPGDPQVL